MALARAGLGGSGKNPGEGEGEGEGEGAGEGKGGKAAKVSSGGTAINWAMGDGPLGDAKSVEVTVLGRRQGFSGKKAQLNDRARSRISRTLLWEVARHLIDRVPGRGPDTNSTGAVENADVVAHVATYEGAKQLAVDYQAAKQALLALPAFSGWVGNRAACAEARESR